MVHQTCGKACPPFPWCSVLKDVLLGLLLAFGLRKPKSGCRPGMYWARDRFGRWELRVPARSLQEAPPA